MRNWLAAALVLAVSSFAAAITFAPGNYSTSGAANGTATTDAAGTGSMNTVTPPYGVDNFTYDPITGMYTVLDGVSGMPVSVIEITGGPYGDPPWYMVTYLDPYTLVSQGTGTWQQTK